MRGLGDDDDGLELAFCPHPVGQALGESSRGEILVLDEDSAFGAVDRIEEQRFAFADLVGVLERRIGARDSDIDRAQVGRDAARPAIA